MNELIKRDAEEIIENDMSINTRLEIIDEGIRKK